jgi:hypothetical protein
MSMDTDTRLAWSALEYEEKERSPDWFWALGITVMTASITAIIFQSYFFAGLLVLAGLLLAFFAIKKPDTIFYELNEYGLKIGNRLYPYENIKSFWVQSPLFSKKPLPGQPELRPAFFVHVERIFMPVLSIPIGEALAEDIHSRMLVHDVAEIEMKEHPADVIMELLGF